MNVNSPRKPTAYLICGFIGAGKTTFARKLEQETGAVRITKDEWLVRIFGNAVTQDRNFAEYDRKVTELARQIAFRILKSGADVILDEGFWGKSERAAIRNTVQELGATPVLYYVESSLDEMRERAVTRSGKPPVDSFEISGEMFDGYVKHWEPPTPEEGYIAAE